MKRSSQEENISEQPSKKQLSDNIDENMSIENCCQEESQHLDGTIHKVDQGTQVDFLEIDEETEKLCICNRYVTLVPKEKSDAMNVSENDANAPPVQYYPIKCEVETLTRIPAAVVEKKVEIVYIEKKQEIKNVKEEKKVCESGFHGYSSIDHEQALIDLAGVTREVFQLLFKILSRRNESKLNNRQKITLENNLLIFLIKMKCGLTFSALSVLFKVHRSTISRIFYSTLDYLSLACKNFVYWPEREIVDETMPSVFKPEYSKCRVIIDATEFVVEKPPTIEQRVQFYSHYKKGFRIKVVIGCLPNGFICLVSKCHGGRASDAQITVSCDLMKHLEPGDVVIGDKGFPHLKTIIDESGKDVLLVMPPFLHNEYFTEEEVETTYKVAKVRIHIERIMQRIRTWRIVEKFTFEMLPYADKIIFMACVLVNLQPPIIDENDE